MKALIINHRVLVGSVPVQVDPKPKAYLFELDRWEPRVFRGIKRILFKKSRGQATDLLDQWILKRGIRHLLAR